MINTSVGGGGGFRGEQHQHASIDVYLVDKNDRKRGIVQITDQLRPRLAVSTRRPDLGLAQLGHRFRVRLRRRLRSRSSSSAPTWTRLTKLANQAEGIMRQVPGVSDVINTDAATSGETQLVVDRSRLVGPGPDLEQVGTSLRTALSGTQVGNYAQAGQPNIPVIVRMNDASRQQRECAAADAVWPTSTASAWRWGRS